MKKITKSPGTPPIKILYNIVGSCVRHRYIIRKCACRLALTLMVIEHLHNNDSTFSALDGEIKKQKTQTTIHVCNSRRYKKCCFESRPSTMSRPDFFSLREKTTAYFTCTREIKNFVLVIAYSGISVINEHPPRIQ